VYIFVHYILKIKLDPRLRGGDEKFHMLKIVSITSRNTGILFQDESSPVFPAKVEDPVGGKPVWRDKL
jgi:hypothetical protein